MQYREKIEEFAHAHQGEAEALLLALASIPAPSRKEEKRAAFVKQYLESMGAKDVRIDAQLNVVWEVPGIERDAYIVFLAHTDVVFADEEELPLRMEGTRLYGPGVGDDSANLVNLLMAARFLLTHPYTPKYSLLFVANACEEGMGNSDGCKRIISDYEGKIRGLYSFDGNIGMCCSRAVGSSRYAIDVHTRGGHSYTDFGQDNAIRVMADIVRSLYDIPLPTQSRTTCNVGRIEGGTTVNSIASDCTILYEYRSQSQDCLDTMRHSFEGVMASFQQKGYAVAAHTVGVRPGSSDKNLAQLQAFTQKSRDILGYYYDDGELDEAAYSTDANIPLSLGIPANTIGTIVGGNGHTREEWVELPSLTTGMKIVLSLVGLYL